MGSSGCRAGTSISAAYRGPWACLPRGGPESSSAPGWGQTESWEQTALCHPRTGKCTRRTFRASTRVSATRQHLSPDTLTAWGLGHVSHRPRPRQQVARQQVQGCEGDRQGVVAPGGTQQERRVVTSPTGCGQRNSLASVPCGHPHPQGRCRPAEAQPCRDGGASCLSGHQPGLSPEDSAGPHAQEQRSMPKADQQHSCPDHLGMGTVVL